MQNNRYSLNKLSIRWLAICFLLSLVALLDYLAPSEKTLGVFIKLVDLHVSLIFATLLLFGTSLIIFCLGLLLKKENYLNKGKKIFITCVTAWALNLLLSMANMKLIWGAIAWQEPKFTMMVTMLFILIISLAIAMFFNTLKIKATIYSLSSIFVIGSLFFTSNVIHPSDAIRASNSLAIKLFPIFITFILFTVGLLISQTLGNKSFRH
jgi:hypothetical protein